jgi:hypothetical protein
MVFIISVGTKIILEVYFYIYISALDIKNFKEKL